MSDRTLASRPSHRRRDGGMTLPELLIAVTVMGLILAVLSSAIIVTLRQESSTEGRLNVARAEQQIGMWLPGDLASAAVVSVDPAANPCSQREEDGEWITTGGSCPGLDLSGGSSALLVGWSVEQSDGSFTWTNVMYHFAPAGDGTFTLTRIECVDSGAGWACTSVVVLKDLPGPPGGAVFEPGVTRPDWVIQVSEPLKANATDESQLAIGDENIKNAKRVVVTVNGGGKTDGAGGGSNQISITAGGTYRNEISGTSLQGAPSFTEARSRCGGPMTLVVDESNSIGKPSAGGSDANIANVKQGVRDFITALIGTPVKLQVVGFHTYSHVLGSTAWHEYFDMTDQADVDALLASVDTLQFVWSGSNGGTNWEEGLFRTFNAADGSTAPVIPETVVFFTDGVPTFDRLVHKTAPGVLPPDPPAPAPGWPVSNGSSYSQVAFNRANYIATWARSSVNLIGVAVGSAMAAGNDVGWVDNPGAGYHWGRGYRQYQRAQTESNIDFEVLSGYASTRDFERASSFTSTRDFEVVRWQSQRDFEVRTGASSSWRNATPTEYYVGWATNTSNRRIDGTRSWYEVTEAEYNSYRTLDGASSSWRTTWTDTTPTDFYTNQPSRPSAYRNVATRSAYAVTEAEYDAYASYFPSNWAIAGWTNVGPTEFYTNQPASPSKYRNITTRTAYAVTQAEYDSYAALHPSDWSVTWGDTTPADYDANQPANPTRYRIVPGGRAWYPVALAEYEQHNTTADGTDGWQVNTGVFTWVSKAEYEANNTVAGPSDGWHDTGTRTYVTASSAFDFEPTTFTSQPGTNTSQYQKVYAAPFYVFDSPTTSAIPAYKTIGRLIAGGDNYVEAIIENGEYSNVKTANLYTTTDWTLLPKALKAIALGECGGTLTLQTKLNGAPATDPFTYQNSRQISATGEELSFSPQVVRTNRQFTTGTFDFNITDGLYRDVVILPENLSDLVGYSPAGWTCRAGTANRSFEVVDIPGAETSPWKGIKVRVAANEAVSCTQAVTR